MPYNVRVGFLSQAGFLFGTVIVPVLLMVLGGAAVQRFHKLDVGTLSKLQIYLFVPVFLFVRVFDSTLSWSEIAGIAGAVLLVKAFLAIPLWILLRRLNVRKDAVSVILLASVIFNAGNFGIPVAERAFGKAGGAVQALIVMVSNLTLWGIGYGLAAALSGKARPINAFLAYFKLPMVYALIAAFGLRALHISLPSPMMYALHSLADGLIPVALITLGVQLARQARWPRWRAVVPVLMLKLLIMPAIAACVVIALHLWPWPGAMIVVAAAGPTAVNTLLLTIEQDGDVELAADCVFWTTLLSAITVTVILALVQPCVGNLPH